MDALNEKEFVLAYAALCKKYDLCVVVWDGGLFVAELGDGDWVEVVALSEGKETYEAYLAYLKGAK